MTTVTVTEICNLFTVNSMKGTKDAVENRKHFGLSFCETGEIVYRTADGQSIVSDCTCAVLLPKGGTYSICRKESGYYPVINFEAIGLREGEFLRFPVDNSHLLFDLYRQMQTTVRDNRQMTAISLFYRILAILMESKNSSRERFALDFIEENIHDPLLNGEKIAAHLSMSESYMCRLFKRVHHISPRQYIIRSRMELAKMLLEDEENTISAICEKCGYTGVYSFSRAFKSSVGVSPRQYRNSILKQSI